MPVILIYLVAQGLSQSIAPLLLFSASLPVVLLLAAIGTAQQVLLVSAVVAYSGAQESFSILRNELFDSLLSKLIFVFSGSVLTGTVVLSGTIWLYDKLLGIALMDALLVSTWSAVLGGGINSALILFKHRAR